MAGKLLIEGWRFVPHSYAIANQWQLLSLQRHRAIDLRMRELPLYRADWQRQDGLMAPAQEAALRAVAPPEQDFIPDVTLRMGFPFDLTPVPQGRLAVFGTSEILTVPADNWSQPLDPAALAERADLTLVTSSHWSAQGFLQAGVPREKVHVVPLGVDVATFKPDSAGRDAMRQRLGIGEGIVFMNAGALTENKGVDLLLRGFAELCQQRQDIYLLLKGSDALYQSNARLQNALATLAPALRDIVMPRVIYGGATVSMTDMAALYRAADVYVSPYRAEGFNLPVLEAMASGLPVICTAGGSTDDFVGNDAALKIASQRVAATTSDGAAGVQLQPGIRHLTSLMARAASDETWRRRAGAAAQAQAADFTWDKAVDKLLALLF